MLHYPDTLRLTIIDYADHVEHRARRPDADGGDILRQWRQRADGLHTVTIQTEHPAYGRLRRGTIRRTPDGWEYDDAEYIASDRAYADFLDAESALIAGTATLDEDTDLCPMCHLRKTDTGGLCGWCYLYETEQTDEKPTTAWDDTITPDTTQPEEQR